MAISCSTLSHSQVIMKARTVHQRWSVLASLFLLGWCTIYKICIKFDSYLLTNKRIYDKHQMPHRSKEKKRKRWIQKNKHFDMEYEKIIPTWKGENVSNLSSNDIGNIKQSCRDNLAQIDSHSSNRIFWILNQKKKTQKIRTAIL